MRVLTSNAGGAGDEDAAPRMAAYEEMPSAVFNLGWANLMLTLPVIA